MCHFITLVAAIDQEDPLRDVLAPHGRTARRIDNASVARALEDGEQQFLTTRKHCDCGTVLAPAGASEDLDTKLAREGAKLARKGWSATKIERALEGRRKAEGRPNRPGPDSFDLWAAVIDDVLGRTGLPHIGLLVHFYSGAIAQETFEVTRRPAASRSRCEALAAMRPDELTIFARV